MENENELQSMPLADIQLAIEESINAVKHLSRSQCELRDAVKEDPDPEFIVAIKENDYILLNKKGFILQLLTELKTQDMTSATTYESSIIALGIELNGFGNSIESTSLRGIEVNPESTGGGNNNNNNPESVPESIENDIEVIDDLQMLPTSIDYVLDNRDRDGMYL